MSVLSRFILAIALLTTPLLAQQPVAPKPVAHPAFPTGDVSPLGNKISTLLADPTVSRAHWGIAVTALDGTPIYGYDEGKLFRPASNAKLFTTAAAMALLGPEKTFDTKVLGKLDETTGTVTGDLVLLGGGDANFGTNNLPYVRPARILRNTERPLGDLQTLADQLKAKGVTHVTGNIVGDDSLFPYEPFGESWAQDDMVWGYGAPVSALTIADNQLKLKVMPGTICGMNGRKSCSDGTAQLEQNGVAYYTLKTEVGVLTAGSHGNIQVERLADPHSLRIYGGLAVDAAPDTEEIAIADSAEYAAMALRSMLQQRGITVDGSSVAKHQQPRDAQGFLTELRAPLRCETLHLEGGACPGGCSVGIPPGVVLASHTSASLAQDVVFTDKESQNLHAEILLHQLGRIVTCSEGSTVEGARMVRTFLTMRAGLDPDDFLFYDGSGLSAKDLVTPRATAQLLSYATTQPWFSQWKSALPIGGVDGTLSSRFKEAPLKGHVFAKTGTLGESRALSGYLDCASGKQVIFSIMVDNHSPTGSGDRAVMDKIVAAIAAAN